MQAEWPRLDRVPVALPPLGGALSALWATLLDLAERLTDVPWTVIGGQMVLLHALEHGTMPPRFSTDIDAAVDVRTAPKGVSRIVAELQALDFRATGASPEGYVHRFERITTEGTAIVDVLVPEGLGPRTDTTTVKPGRAFPVPGATQALVRTELVPIRRGDGIAWLPRPSLLGAVVAKAMAATIDRREADRHLVDLAFLCGLVDEPLVLREAVASKDRARLAKAAALLPREHPAWEAAGDPDQAWAAWRLLRASAG
jgi:hypothetical protein